MNKAEKFADANAKYDVSPYCGSFRNFVAGYKKAISEARKWFEKNIPNDDLQSKWAEFENFMMNES